MVSMQIRGISKRGQSASTTFGEGSGTIIVIVLLVLAIAVVAIYLLPYLKKLGSSSGLTDIDTAKAGCAGTTVGSNYFCTDLKYVELDGKKMYVTCEYLASRYPGEISGVACSSTDRSNLISKCKSLKETNIVINGAPVASATTSSNDCASVPGTTAVAIQNAPAAPTA